MATRLVEETGEPTGSHEPNSGRGLRVVYLMVDGVYEAMRSGPGARYGILVARRILEDGRRVLVHLELGNRGILRQLSILSA